MIEPQPTNLDRYVLPVDQPVPLVGGGFLDLRPHGGYRVDRAAPRPVVELAGAVSSFVLLAPGGAGKTTVLRALRQAEPKATEVDLRVLDKSGMNNALLSALATGQPIYLDALDEVALHKPAVFRVIEHYLASPMAKVLSWRLACRPAAWNPGLAAALKVLPAFEELRLLPLTRVQVKAITGAVEADPDTLVTALETTGLSRLTAAPRQLETAARRWAAGEPLPADRVEALELEVREMLGESDQGRPQPELSTDQQFRVAGRMAAISIFGGIARFAPSGTPAPALLPINMLPTFAEPGPQELPIRPRQYEEVIGTALFDATPNSSVTFRPKLRRLWGLI